MPFKINGFSKITYIFLLTVSFQLHNNSICSAEEKPVNNPPISDAQKTQPSNDSNPPNNSPSGNAQGSPQQDANQQTQKNNSHEPEPQVAPPPPPEIQNENPSVKSKKLPPKKNKPQPKKEDAAKSEEQNKEERKEENKEESKMLLPEVLPDDIAPPNNNVPSTYGGENQGNNFIKGIIAWILIAIGVFIIAFVIIFNRKISMDSSSLFQGKHDLKTKSKKSRSYDKNIRRK